MINLFILIFLILLIHYSFFLISILRGIIKLKPVTLQLPLKEFVSVIIPFRNESENILENLKSIESQNYPCEKFEVIYVNDGSTDNSLSILKENVRKGNIKIFSLENNIEEEGAHKKRAVRYGIENSAGEIIVTTDADCSYQPDWLLYLLSTFEEGVGFVSGPVEYIIGENFFFKMQALEFAGLILTGAALIEMNNPIICNGANIAYRKALFKSLNGFQDQLHLSSGDDGFLMQKIHKQNKYRIKFCLSKKTVVKTKPVKSVSGFFNQRKRWASKNIFYRDKKLVVKLIFIFAFYLGLTLQLFLGIFLSAQFLFLFVFSIAVKSFLEYLILRKGKKILFTGLQLNCFLITEFFQIPYILISSIGGIFGNFSWKGRKLKR